MNETINIRRRIKNKAKIEGDSFLLSLHSSQTADESYTHDENNADNESIEEFVPKEVKEYIKETMKN